MSGPVVALSGGVGGSKLVHGLSMVLPADELTVIVNTGDDFQHLGLTICPDLDSVVYTLAGLADPVKGWGRVDETWSFMAALADLGGEDWFQLGDRDLAIHVERSWRLARGATLSDVTAKLCRALNVNAQVLPMSNDPVRTQLLTDQGRLDFQHYFVRRQCQPVVRAVEFAGAAQARPQAEALTNLQRSDLRAIVICPSNPFVSVAPILAVPGIRAAIERSPAPVIAVTPIIGGKSVRGPAGKMLREFGLDVSGQSVAKHYAGLVNAFIIDESDAPCGPIPTVTIEHAPTLMRTLADRASLARTVLAVADSLR